MPSRAQPPAGDEKLFDTVHQYSDEGGKTMTLTEKVMEAMELIRPYLQRDGGDFDLVGVEDGIVKIRLKGACGSCPASMITLKQGIERSLKEDIPEIVSVEQVY